MGRHASPAPAPPGPQDADEPRLRGLASRHLPRLALAAAAAVTTALAVVWTGNPWSTALVTGGLVAVVVLGAAWLAATVPQPPGPATPAAEPTQPIRPPRSAPGAGPDPVQ